MKQDLRIPVRYALSGLPVSTRNILLLLSMTLLGGCSSLSYYSQSVSGQFAIMTKKQDIDALISDAQTPLLLRQKLRTVKSIRDFAAQELFLPAKDSYEEYSDIGRPYVVWNVFAAPEFSLEPVRWCFLVVGCLGYRGYFNKAQAQGFADSLRQQGLDVYIGGVSAFSTLGWLDDPVMNTMLGRVDHELARLLFHELSHQKIYVKDDTDFNEAFADAVAIIGMERWVNALGRAEQTLQRELMRERQFSELVLRYREKLQRLYSSAIPDEEMRAQKSELIAALRRDCQKLRADRGGDARFDSWIKGPINNARLAAMATYQYFVADFIAIYIKTGRDLSAFYAIVRQLAACRQAHRHRLLQQRTISINC